MELQFQQVHLPYLQSIYYETIGHEESVESIVPDSLPDIERIVDSFATVLLRTSECRDGTLSLSGDIQAGILYLARDEAQPRHLPLYLPFALRRSVVGDDCRCTVACRVRSIEPRLLHSRKLALRVSLCVEAQVWEPREELCYRPAPMGRRVQLRSERYPMKLPVECCEKHLLLRDTLPLAAHAARVLHADARCEVDDEKLSGDKAVCKGELFVHAVYETDDGAVGACEVPLPYSAIVELSGEYEEQGLLLTPVLTSLEAVAEDGQLAVEAGVCMQCVVLQTAQVDAVADAYATRGHLELSWCDYAMQPQLDTRVLRQELRAELPGKAAEVLHASACLGQPQVEWAGNLCRIRVEVQLQALVRDPSGVCQQLCHRAEVRCEVGAAPSRCVLSAGLSGAVFAAPAPGGVEVRVPVAIRCAWYAAQGIRSVCGGTLEDEPAPEERPAVIIRTLPADTDLWDIAKELRTTVSAIQIANDTEAPTAPAGTMLLVPIVA